MKSEDAFSYFEARDARLGRNRSGKIACADALGVTKGAVYAWGDLVPPLSAALIEDITLRDVAEGITEQSLEFDPYVYVAAGWHKPPHLRPN